MNVLLIILVSYIIHIFGCRSLNLWMMKNKQYDNTNTDYYIAVGAWFIPFFGGLYICFFAIRLAFLKWKLKDSPLLKWFVEGEEFKWGDKDEHS